jgi:flagellar motor protein MotB
MRKGLRRTSWLLGLFALGALGCATDERNYVVEQAMTFLDESTKKLDEIHTNVRRMIDIGKDKGGIRMTNPEITQKLEAAKKAAEALSALGRDKVQRLKGLADRISGKATPESKKELRELNSKRFEESALKLEKVDRELVVSLAEAEAAAGDDKDSRRELKALREEIRKAKEVFEVLTKHR